MRNIKWNFLFAMGEEYPIISEKLHKSNKRVLRIRNKQNNYFVNNRTSNFLGTIDDESWAMCKEWTPAQHSLFQTANFFFAAAFLVPGSFKQSVLLVRWVKCHFANKILVNRVLCNEQTLKVYSRGQEKVVHGTKKSIASLQKVANRKVYKRFLEHLEL